MKDYKEIPDIVRELEEVGEHDKAGEEFFHYLPVAAVRIFGKDKHRHARPEHFDALVERSGKAGVRIGGQKVHSAVDKQRKEGFEKGLERGEFFAVPLLFDIEHVAQISAAGVIIAQHLIGAPLGRADGKVEFGYDGRTLCIVVADEYAGLRNFFEHSDLRLAVEYAHYHRPEEGKYGTAL